MLKIETFTFNPFEENTYVLSDSTGECIIIDPGCYTKEEKSELERFITAQKLKPVRILLTHAHIDHILGNNFLAGKYQIPIQMCKIEEGLLKAAPEYGKMWGIECESSPEPELFVEEGKDVCFGNTTLKTFFTPGHSPGSFSYYHKETNALFSGDVLFMQSIGRTDLPGGDFDTLIKSIKEKLFKFPDSVRVYSGHGPTTTIGFEKENNPFLQTEE
jgi:glyoxylase-like metal-dependent hydrolase (beta-lactamase superfamily II)